jgi:hypothetical protein
MTSSRSGLPGAKTRPNYIMVSILTPERVEQTLAVAVPWPSTARNYAQ